jgi:hypothetical protein
METPELFKKLLDTPEYKAYLNVRTAALDAVFQSPERRAVEALPLYAEYIAAEHAELDALREQNDKRFPVAS